MITSNERLTRLNLDNVVWEPTRITHTSATCVDLFIVNRPNLILDIKVSQNFCSDQCPVSVDINIKSSVINAQLENMIRLIIIP